MQCLFTENELGRFHQPFGRSNLLNLNYLMWRRKLKNIDDHTCNLIE